MSVPSPNLHVDALTPNVIILKMGPWGGNEAEMRTRGWGPGDGISGPIRRDASAHTAVRTQGEGSCLTARKRTLISGCTGATLILDF